MKSVSILGSGMAGCGAAHRLSELGIPSVMYEMRSHYGGHTASYEFDEGFTFDEGPHVSFSKNARIKEILAKCIDGEFVEHKTKVNNYWKGYWIKHPAQVNLFGLPEDLIAKCIDDFKGACDAEHGPINNYEDWLLAAFGETFARTFPMEYTKKYHTTTADNMSTDWVGPRLYRPELDEVIRGATEPKSVDVHYIEGFRYPKRGGFGAYLKALVAKSELRLDHKMVAIDPKQKTITFENGKTEKYEGLVSSVPLPDMIPAVEGAPKDVLAAAARLACSEAVIVSVGIDRADIIDAHWTYFYDEDYFFTRLSTPHLQSEHNVPDGCGSIQAECYYSQKYRPLDRRPEDCIEPVIADLRRCGLFRDSDKILFKHALHVPYANVIFDLERKQALDTVHGFLDDVGIGYCGRYGDWTYIWTDQAFMSGERAAERVVG